jgi:hypothetical protein
MSRVITFSRTYPSYHPKAGQPTHFVEKVMNSFHLDALGERFFIPFEEDLYQLNKDLPYDMYMEFRDGLFKGRTEKFKPKYHTIRAGHRFKVGDKFSPRVWGDDINPKSGRKGPYNSKQITFAPDIEVKKVWDFKMIWDSEVEVDIFINGKWNCQLGSIQSTKFAANDGLTIEEFACWFKVTDGKPFDGQIICWNEKINY